MNKEERIKVAKKFAEKALEKFGNLIKSIVLFGSSVREEFKEKSDIDILIIIDETILKRCEKCNSIYIDAEDKLIKCPKCNSELTTHIPESYFEEIDEELEKIANSIKEAKIKEIDPITKEEKEKSLISLQPVYLMTQFWDYVRQGHPIVYNFIKEGIAIYDSGFFKPLQRLWKLGKIPLTREAIEKYIEEVPKRIARVKSVKLLQIAEDCYYAIVNSAQAVLMFLGKEPPAPSKLYEVFKAELVDKNLVEPELAEWIKEIIELRKKIEHQEIINIDGKTLDLWIERAEKFSNKMIILLNLLELKKIENIAEKTYSVMLELISRALSSLKIEFNKENMIEIFKKEFISKGLIPNYFKDTIDRVIEVNKLIKNKEYEKINFEEVYNLREAVRLLIRDTSKALKELGIKE